MLLWILRILALVGSPVLTYYVISPDLKGILVGVVCALVLVVMEFLLQSVNLITLMIGVAGAIMGIIVSKFFDAAVLQINIQANRPDIMMIFEKFHLLSQFFWVLLGTIIAVRKAPKLDDLDTDISLLGKRRGSFTKIMDTSSIIDGRIIDICDTYFISGTLIVPKFVMNELHILADSQDAMKRARGRRGLDILSRLQESKKISFKILEKDIPGLKDVDSKVIRLAKEMNAQVITTDFNMNKIAALEAVTVLNINDLTTALKPVVLPGENMSLFVMKEGKERDQGVGYLDDGTMVVVEEGRRWIGKRIEVSVYSILQTSAGRMIFTKAKWEKGHPHDEQQGEEISR